MCLQAWGEKVWVTFLYSLGKIWCSQTLIQISFFFFKGFPGGSDGKASACNAGDRIRSLGQEDPLEKETATPSRILAWRIPWMEESGRYSPWGREELDMWERLHFLFSFKWVTCCSWIWMNFGLSWRLRDLPPMQEMHKTWVWSLGWEVPLENGMVIHSRILAWRIPWTEKPGRLQSVESQRATNTHSPI